jgi:hypothetical protein
MEKELPINSRIIAHLAKVTVKNILDAIVELVTNSDDSYRRLEEKGQKVSGEINIYLTRKKGGHCESLKVKDYAEGMSKEELEKALVYGSETSGITEGRSVRGLFGRGLKEAIIALGEGEIKTIKNGKLCSTKVWFDKKQKKAFYDKKSLDNIIETSEKNGTEINIIVKNEKMKVPEFKTFKDQLSKHYQLRDINSSNNRKISLTFHDLKRGKTFEEKITFSYPDGKKVKEETIELPNYKDKVKIIVYESLEPLEFSRYNPCGRAGILIKTKGAILDNQLFKFENDQAAFYFFGEAICEGLEERLRKGETEIIDPNRGGLEWRHEYCQALAKAIENILEPLINEKRKILEKGPKKEVEKAIKKKINDLCKLLNELATQEFEDEEIGPGPNITRLIIKPEKANLQINKPRIFSVYAPDDLVKKAGKIVNISSDNIDIKPLVSTVNLNEHPNREKIWYNYFKVIGKKKGAEGIITVTLGNDSAIAKVEVTTPKKRKKGKIITGTKEGFISDIQTDETENPLQRVIYKQRIIKIYIKFPSVTKFIEYGPTVKTPEGKMLLAELVGEAFCKELARQGIERGKYIVVPISEPVSGIDAFNAAVNELQRKYLHIIQEFIFKKF